MLMIQGTRAETSGTGRVFRSSDEMALVGLTAVLAGVGGALAGCQPSGVDWANPLLTGALAAGIALLGAFAGWRWLLAAAAVALVATRSWWGLTVAMIAFGLAGYSSTRRRGPRSIRSVSAALTVQVVLRLPHGWHFGLTAVVAALACGLIAFSALVRCPRRVRQIALGLISATVGLAALATVLFGLGTLLSQSNLEDAVSNSALAIDSAAVGNTQQASGQFEDARDNFRRANGTVNAWWARPVRLVPWVGLQARAVQDMAREGQALASTGTGAVNTVERNRATATGGHFDLARIAAAVPDLDQSATELAAAQSVAASVNSPWLLGALSSRITRVAVQAAKAESVTRNAALAAHLAPILLGGDKPAVYFVAFVTPVEQRGSGGFMGSFAELTVTDGQLEMTRYGRTDELNKAHDPAQPITGPVEWTQHYAGIDPSVVWSNITLSPDLPTVAQVISRLYPASGGRPIDGVITIDPAGLAALLKITGPIKVPGLATTLSPKNTEQFLEHDQYTAFARDNGRTDYLADAAEIAFRKLVRADIPRPDKLAEILSPAILGEHIRWTQLDTPTQALPEALLTTGSLSAEPGDFVQLVTQNYANNKLDAFMHRALSYDVSVDPATGEASGTAHVELTNNGPSSGLPEGVIGNERYAPLGTNISQVSLYSALTTSSARLDAQPVELQSFSEAGRHAATVMVSIPPGGHRTVDFAVSGRIALPGGRYHLTVGHQVTVIPDAVVVSVRSAQPTEGANPDGKPFVSGPGGIGFEATLEQRISAWARFG
jgi:hypothetical protein